MQDFKKFLIRLQTFDIKLIEWKFKRESPPYNVEIGKAYDLTHENVAMSPSFENDLLRMKELAIMDLLTLPLEQVKLQSIRLNHLKDKFEKFENRYYLTYRGESDELKIFFSKLNLQEDFMVNGINPEQFDVKVTDQFLDDLYDSMIAKREVLLKFEEEIISMFQKNDNVDSDYLPHGKASFISEDILNDLTLILKPYLNKVDGDKLDGILKGQASGPITFNGQGIQLADAFRQLYEANLIVGYTKAVLQTWIKKQFNYIDKGNIKLFTDKYLSDIISSNTKICQSPILEIQKKENGQFGVFPTLRKNKF